MTIVSLLLNVALGAALFLDSAFERPGSPASSSGADKTSPAQLMQWVRRQGGDDAIAYELALSVARAATAVTIPDEYWKPAPGRSAALREAEYKSTLATRELLLKELGPEAKDVPAFAAVFQPFRHRFAFLSADKQMALQQILFETSNAAPQLMGPDSAARSERSERIAALLTQSELFEYQLRESPTAMRLANSGFDFSEGEFRAVYSAVASTSTQRNDAQSLLAAMPAVERALGTDRFQEFNRAQDPVYRWLQSGAKRFAVSQDIVTSAYAAIKAADKRVSELKGQSRQGANFVQARADLFAARDRELTERLGAEMFSYIAPYLPSSAPASASWPGDPRTAIRPMR